MGIGFAIELGLGLDYALVIGLAIGLRLGIRFAIGLVLGLETGLGGALGNLRDFCGTKFRQKKISFFGFLYEATFRKNAIRTPCHVGPFKLLQNFSSFKLTFGLNLVNFFFFLNLDGWWLVLGVPFFPPSLLPFLPPPPAPFFFCSINPFGTTIY